MLQDTLGRHLKNLRISVTDRCNLRCRYCMPEEEYVWLSRNSILSFEEIDRLVRVFVRLGVEKIRLTGGEPTLRRDLDVLVRLLAGVPGIAEIALTTNGTFLDRQAGALRAAGLHRITVSLDTLRPERYEEFTRSRGHADVLRGIAAARAAGFERLKINTVLVRGYNSDELIDLVRFGRNMGVEIRFIEYMDVGGATHWSMDQVVPRNEILNILSRHFGPILPREVDPPSPAERFALADGTIFGVIASTTAPFCRSCNRARLTADGVWYLCLYAGQGLDLRALLRGGASDEEIEAAILSRWRRRTDRGAEERVGLGSRAVLFEPEQLQKDPHLEMHTRGG